MEGRRWWRAGELEGSEERRKRREGVGGGGKGVEQRQVGGRV